MTKLAVELHPLSTPYASQPDLGAARRLIVPVTSTESDLTAVTRRVWELASTNKAHIQFIGLCNDPSQEHSLRRTVVTMSAMVNYDDVSADVEVVTGKNWVEYIKSRYQPGDMVVCFDGQGAGISQKPLSQILQSELNIPLYILAGTYKQNDTRASWATKITAWTGFIVIILGFFMLQVRIDHFAEGLTIVLQILTVAVEFWLLWTWNSLFK
jgi:hypothetical protein